MKAEIILPFSPGHHNADLKKANERLTASQSYKDLSTIIVVPTRGGRSLTPRFVSSMMGLMRAMNQKTVGPIWATGMEVGKAYNSVIEMILGNPELSKFKFVFTAEDDNLIPPDGLLKLYEGMKDYDSVGGLYWCKGESGAAMIYGNPGESPLNYIPQKPIPETIQRCTGLGMGAELSKMDLFRKIPAPWFEKIQDWDPQKGSRGFTQDLSFFEKVAKIGGKVACDTRVKVGHYDIENDMVW